MSVTAEKVRAAFLSFSHAELIASGLAGGIIEICIQGESERTHDDGQG